MSPKGALVFRTSLGADVDCAPSIGADGTIYVGTDAGEVVALDRTGAVRFRARVGGYVRGGLTLTRTGAVVAGTYGPAPRVVALDAATGAERWSFAVPGTGAAEFGVHGSPLEDAEGNLYFGAQDDVVYALDPRGRLRWTFRTGADVDAPLVLGPVPGGSSESGPGVLYVGSDDGLLRAVR